MIRRGRADAGFTLVEVILVGVLSVVVTAGLAAFLRVYNGTISEGTANALIQQQSEIVIDQVSRNVQSAIQVAGPAETYSATPSGAAAVVTEIQMFDSSRQIFAAYKIQDGLLKEAHPDPPAASLLAVNYQPFMTGGGSPVRVTDISNFTLAAERRSVTINLAVKTAYRGVEYSTLSRNETVNCRN